MFKIDNHYNPFVLICKAFILLHILRCSGQQSWRQIIFIELQAKHQSSLGVENDDESLSLYQQIKLKNRNINKNIISYTNLETHYNLVYNLAR